MTIGDLSKYIIIGFFLLIIIIVISVGGDEKSVSETSQPQIFQEQSELEIENQQEQQDREESQREIDKINLENCLQEANAWFNQAKQTTVDILEEEEKTYNPHQEFIDQHSSSLDEIMILLLEELEDYKTECYKKYPQR